MHARQWLAHIKYTDALLPDVHALFTATEVTDRRTKERQFNTNTIYLFNSLILTGRGRSFRDCQRFDSKKNPNRLLDYPRPTVAITLVAATIERVLPLSKGTNNSPAPRPWKRLFSGDSRCGLIDQSWTSFHRAPSCLAEHKGAKTRMFA